MPTRGDGLPELKADLKKLKGRVAFVEGARQHRLRRLTQDSWRWMGSKTHWREPPETLVKLHDQSTREVFAAIGLNPSLFGDADGTALRESYRQAVHTLIQPLGLLVAAELSEKLETEISFDFSRIMAADIQGRARALKSLTESGVAIDRALELAGFSA